MHPDATFFSFGITKWVGRTIPDDAAVNDTKAGEHFVTEHHRDPFVEQQLDRRSDFGLQVRFEALRRRNVNLDTDASGVGAVQMTEKPMDGTRGKIGHAKQDLFLCCVEIAADAVVQFIARGDDCRWRLLGRINGYRFDRIGKRCVARQALVVHMLQHGHTKIHVVINSQEYRFFLHV